MKRLFLLFVLFLLTVTAMAQMAFAQTTAPQFSADMTVKSPHDRGMTGKMYMGAGKMRMDMTSEGGRMSMITDSAKKTSTMVMHDQKMYMEMSAEGRGMGPGPMSRGPKMPDIKAMDGTPCSGMTGATCKMAGAEMMNDRMCDRWEVTSANKSEAGTVWVEQKTKMPIKSVKGDGTTWELTNFKEGPQDASVFAVPAGYEKFDMGAMMQRRQR